MQHRPYIPGLSGPIPLIPAALQRSAVPWKERQLARASVHSSLSKVRCPRTRQLWSRFRLLCRRRVGRDAFEVHTRYPHLCLGALGCVRMLLALVGFCLGPVFASCTRATLWAEDHPWNLVVDLANSWMMGSPPHDSVRLDVHLIAVALWEQDRVAFFDEIETAPTQFADASGVFPKLDSKGAGGGISSGGLSFAVLVCLTTLTREKQCAMEAEVWLVFASEFRFPFVSFQVSAP